MASQEKSMTNHGLPTLWPSGPRRAESVLRIAHHKTLPALPAELITVFDSAAEAGAHLVEFDTWVTADDVLVVQHGPVISDGEGKQQWILDLTYEALVTLQHEVLDTASAVAVARDSGVGIYLDLKALSRRAAFA